MRRAGAAKREILPDPKYGSKIVAKFVNMMMYGGKKSTAEKIMYEAMGAMEDRAKQDALKLFKAVLDGLGSDAEIVFAPGYDHTTIFRYDHGLLRHNLDQMKQQLEREHVL